MPLDIFLFCSRTFSGDIKRCLKLSTFFLLVLVDVIQFVDCDILLYLSHQSEDGCSTKLFVQEIEKNSLIVHFHKESSLLLHLNFFPFSFVVHSSNSSFSLKNWLGWPKNIMSRYRRRVIFLLQIPGKIKMQKFN